MKTGDVVRDAQGRGYQVGPLLGRGLWGKSYLCRASDNDVELVIKRPLVRSDFKGEAPITEATLDACVKACAEQVALLSDPPHPFLLTVQAKAPQGELPFLALPRFTSTLDRRINQGCTLSEVLRVSLKVLEHLKVLADARGPHGNLRASNVLLNDRGEVSLSDVATESVRRNLGGLEAVANPPPAHLAPELRGLSGPANFTQASDTYAVGMMIYQAVLTPRGGDSDGRLALKLPREGLDKAALVELKDRIVERIKQEDSNPRFHARFAERLAAVLNRAISKQLTPSPPYRFTRVEDMQPRLAEVVALIRPGVDAVGKVMLSRPPTSDTFETDEDIAFTVSVGASAGVDTHEEIACGVALFDAESDERIRDVVCNYTVDERHRSGRFRFAFKLDGLGPGRYRCRLAFAIRDSGHPPATAETEFEIRAAAGYVPPQSQHLGGDAIPFGRPDDGGETAVTRPDALLDGGMPTPIAPPTPSLQVRSPMEAAVAADQGPRVVAEVGISDSLDNEVAEVFGFHAYDTPISQDQPSEENTHPAFHLNSQVPQADALDDIVGAGSWTELPLPGSSQPELGAPLVDDVPEPPEPNALMKLIETIKGDTYLLYMSIAGVVIVALSILLFLLDS
ncbi:MAG: protein kinase [Alphaproteobacteria bacterium]|nr:protein kinase [Alphaproteobacteria bacterium]